MSKARPDFMCWPIFETLIFGAGERGAIRIKNARRLLTGFKVRPANDNTDISLNPDGTLQTE